VPNQIESIHFQVLGFANSEEDPMRNAIFLGFALVLLVAVSGCASSPDSLVKDQIKAMNELAEAMETNAAEAKVQEIQKKIEEINKKLEDLKLSDEDKKKLLEKHKGEMEKAVIRLAKAGLNKTMGDFGKVFGGQLPGAPNLGNLPGLPVTNEPPKEDNPPKK
jgi:TolA-binding protein